MSDLREQRRCICPHEERSLGTLNGIRMGRGNVRVDTAAGCPEHDSCHGYTAAVRADRPWWSDPWCPIHKNNDCPEAA